MKAVVFYKNIWDKLIAFLKEIGKRELSGFTYGTIKDGITWVEGILFPKQTVSTPVSCDFDGAWMVPLGLVLAELKEEAPLVNLNTWLHTHPGLTTFYSGTDYKTYFIYKELQEKIVGLVIDPFEGENGKARAYFSSDGKKLEEISVFIFDKEKTDGDLDQEIVGRYLLEMKRKQEYFEGIITGETFLVSEKINELLTKNAYGTFIAILTSSRFEGRAFLKFLRNEFDEIEERKDFNVISLDNSNFKIIKLKKEVSHDTF